MSVLVSVLFFFFQLAWSMCVLQQHRYQVFQRHLLPCHSQKIYHPYLLLPLVQDYHKIIIEYFHYSFLEWEVFPIKTLPVTVVLVDTLEMNAVR